MRVGRRLRYPRRVLATCPTTLVCAVLYVNLRCRFEFSHCTRARTASVGCFAMLSGLLFHGFQDVQLTVRLWQSPASRRTFADPLWLNVLISIATQPPTELFCTPQLIALRVCRHVLPIVSPTDAKINNTSVVLCHGVSVGFVVLLLSSVWIPSAPLFLPQAKLETRVDVLLYYRWARSW